MLDEEKPSSFSGPTDESARAAWRAEWTAWRTDARRRLGFDGSAYLKPEFQWATKCFACNKIMVWDETFLDHRTGHYRVEEYLDEGKTQFGGYDAVVLWQAYPRIGFDDRNQFDHYRLLPGGLPGVRDMVRRLHRHGVRAFIDYNPWDTGTRREGVSDAEAIGQLVHDIEADGVFLDTLNKGSMDMRVAVDRGRPGVAFESEEALVLESMSLNHLSWAQWFDPGDAATILRNKWFEQRHMMHVIRRWNDDHTNELHLAWMNGAGMLIWENVFGSWMGWNPENRQMVRQMLPIQRHFARHFSEGQWTPLVATRVPEVFASEWDLDGHKIWTIANRSTSAVTGLNIDVPPGVPLFDLIHGGPASLDQLHIEARGIAAVGTVAGPKHSATSSDAPARRFHPALISPAVATRASVIVPPEMVRVEAGKHTITTHFRVRECGQRDYAQVINSVYPDLHQDVTETREIQLGAFAIATREVTNGEFQEFLGATRYRPRIRDRFLEHWVDGHPKREEMGHPVTFVDLEDARAYAHWKGQRLPTDAEWQIAMEQQPADRLQPAVWNWTDSEYSDGRTRFCLLKGGADYVAKGSEWYADGGVRPANFAAKYLEYWPGMDRCATIGFRCAVTLEGA